jgi:hypothetical protein
MKGDFTRFTFDRRKHYSGIRMQQGRAQLDADWNELGDIHKYRREVEYRDFIGTPGVPRAAAGLGVRAWPDGAGLTLSAGRLYADGHLCENEADVAITAQPDLPGYVLPTADGLYLAYADVWEHNVTAIEDPALREPALGGAETATRIKTLWQVKLLHLPGADPQSRALDAFPAWDALVAAPAGALAARTSASIAGQLDNRLYRVEIHEVDEAVGTVTFKWSRDNGSVVAAWLGQTGVLLSVSGPARADAGAFASGHWVELLDDERELRGQHGTLVRLLRVVGDTLELEPATATGPIDLASFGSHPRARRWDSGGAVAVPADGSWIALERGVEVQLAPPAAGAYRAGDYWLVPARAATGGVEWPQSGPDPIPMPPHGIHHAYARLALVELRAGVFTVREDARFQFLPLIDLKELTVLRAANNAPPGSIYVDGLGNVGFGTSTPEARLDIEGSLRLAVGPAVDEISTDPTFGDATDAAIPTGRAVKDYVDDLVAKAMPPGAIVMWSGRLDAIPVGWRLCDGSQGTPDLRSRFVVGAGAGYAVGATGGADQVTLTAAQMPSHNHGYSDIYWSEVSGWVDVPGGVGNWGPEDHDNRGHEMGRATGHAGGSQPHENRPPYYALAYIMKL